MSDAYPRLIGDIGGTHARWAWQPGPHAELQDVQVHRSAMYPSLAASAAAYLRSGGHRAPRAAGIGIATAIVGDEVRMTNHHWAFSVSALQAELGVQRCLVINDFSALALSLPVLGAHELHALGTGAAVPGAPLALLGPGTGLGVSGLMPRPEGGWTAISGEGGHVTLAAADDEEAALLAWMRRRFGHVSAERALSGPGLVNLYEASCGVQGVSPRGFSPAEVSGHALANSDAQCQAAARHFSALLGTVAGNLALTLGARGGVYIGGGVVPRMGAAFDSALFRRRFEAKGRFADYLQPLPCWLITARHPALLGVARALDLMLGATP